MKEQKSQAFEEILEIYETLVAALSDVERKGKTMPYTSMNGNMFTFLDKDGTLAIRLSKSDREELMERYGLSLKESYGVVQKEYVGIPDLRKMDREMLESYFRKSYAYAKTLKAKATKKR